MMNGITPTNLTYDDEDRLKTINGLFGSHTYTYNGFDTRVGKNGTSYHRDGAGVTAPLLSDDQATYTPGISERRAGVTTFSHGGLKDGSAQTDNSQNITATKQYDAYGQVLTGTGIWKGPFGYGGQAGYQTDESGLQLLGHRYYDPSTGRFLTRDPIKDGRNWYGYCDNNPVSRIDASGLDWHDPTSISVDPNFKGKVWVVGEPGKGKDQVFVELKPGESTPAGFDVDIVIVQTTDSKGRVSQKRYFVPGASPPQDMRDLPSSYTVDRNGKVVPGPDVYYEWGRGRFPGPDRDTSFGHSYPVLAPREFGPGWRGWYGSGNWNNDIEAAKRRPYKI